MRIIFYWLIIIFFISCGDSIDNRDMDARTENNNETFFKDKDSTGNLIEWKRYGIGKDGTTSLMEYIHFDTSMNIDFEKSFFLFPLVNLDTIYSKRNIYKVDFIGYFQGADSCRVTIERPELNLKFQNRSHVDNIHLYVDNLHEGFNMIKVTIEPFIKVDSIDAKIFRHLSFNKVIYYVGQ